MVEVNCNVYSDCLFWSLDFIPDIMTLLELYEKLCRGQMRHGLCFNMDVNGIDYREFQEIMCDYKTEGEIWNSYYFDGRSLYIEPKEGLTPLRETFLLLFAAYKGEL